MSASSPAPGAFDNLTDEEVRRCFTEPIDPAVGRKLLAKALDAARTDRALEDMRREIMEAKVALGLAGGGTGRTLAEEIRCAIEAERHCWIPCSERLPELDVPVLIHGAGALRPAQTMMAIRRQLDETQWCWCWATRPGYTGSLDPCHVTHWQPLPEPPA